MPLAQFVAFHAVPEDATGALPLDYAVMIARTPQGVVLVHSRLRKLWELPGGAIDPGETPRQAAIRELFEESGCVARNTRWLSVVEVNDGGAHFGGCLCCEVDPAAEYFSNAETVSVGYWRRELALSPLGHPDEAVLRRFG